MIRHIALAILLLLIASAPAAAAQTHLGSYATGPSFHQPIVSPSTTGTATTTGKQQGFPPFEPGTYRKPGVIELHLDCAYCAGHDGGVGQLPN